MHPSHRHSHSAVSEEECLSLILHSFHSFCSLCPYCRHSHDPEVLQRHVVKRLTPSLEQQILFHAMGKHAVAPVNRICEFNHGTRSSLPC